MSRHLVLFDIDGTLLRTPGAGRLALGRALTTAFGIAAPNVSAGFAGRTDRAIAWEALTSHGLDADEERFALYLDAYLTHLPACLAERAGEVLPGVLDLLEALARRDDVLLGLLTGNVERAARVKLEHYGLDRFFGDFAGGFGDRHHERDDVARDAKRVFEARGTGTGAVWVVGDTPADVRCARAIGARAVAVAAGFAAREELVAAGPDHLLDDFTDLAAFVGLLDA